MFLVDTSDNSYTNMNDSEIAFYSENAGSEINVFFLYNENNSNAGGRAKLCANNNRVVLFKGAWQQYLNHGNAGFWGNAWVLVHETGHNMGLLHTMQNRDVCYDMNDFCSDTPLYSEIINQGFPDPCPSWGDTLSTKSNNLMDYSGQQVVTPQQLCIIHYTLMDSMLDFIYDDYCTINQNELEYVLESGQDLTWQNDRVLKNNLIIESGAKLTLKNCVLYVPDGAGIIIKPNGKLIVDGATITNRCGLMWQGIEVWGNSNTHQFVNQGHYGQGYIELKNGAVIENAKCAVELWRPNHWSTTGGIIHASDATFRNNAMAVRALCYTNYHPYHLTQSNYNAYFENCNFVIDNDYLGTYDFEKHVVLVEVKGIRFVKCDFSADRSVDGVHPWCIGISAYDAGFTVSSSCRTNVPPCPEADINHSTFTGLHSGICASGSGINPQAFTVRGAIFNNNDYGIHVLNSNYPTILFNEFKIGGGGYCDYNYGVCLENSTGFWIEENYFHPTPTTQSSTVGVAIYSSNGINDVYRNTFEGLRRATLAIGQNTNGSTGVLQGLTFTCNEFSGNRQDIIVLKNNGVGDIQSQQGSSTTPAGNTFVSSTFQIYNDGTTPMDYYYNSTESDETPNTSMLYRVTRHGTTSANSCDSHYGDNPIVRSPSEKAALASDYLFAYNAYLSLKQIYENYMDNSDMEDPTADNSPTSAEMLQLSSQMAQYGHEYTLAAGDIVRSNLNDSIANPTELRTWLRNMNDIAADRMAISSYIQEGDSASAFALANRLPAMYELQGDQLTDHNDYLRLIRLYQSLHSSSRNVFQLTETEANLVRDVAENGIGVSQSMAKVLREQITGKGEDACLDLEMPKLGDGGKGRMTDSDVYESKTSSMNVSVGPNPATTWTTVNYTLPEEGKKALLTLTNSIGVNVLSMELEGVQGNKVLDLRGFAAGVYVYTIRYEQYTEMGKLVITK